MSEAHWQVLGAGAIGCLFAAALYRTGTPVTLLLRQPASRPEVRLSLDTDEGRTDLQLPVDHCADDGPIEHLLVATKAYDVREAVRSVAHRLDRRSQVLLMVNGMGLSAQLRGDYPWLDIFQGTTTEGAYRLGPRHVRHAGRGQTRVGQPGRSEPPDWFGQWSRAVADCQWDPAIDEALWLKLAVNCAINPLTALHDCRNGELARQPELSGEVSRLCGEIARVCTAAGQSQVAARVHTAVREVIAGTADNRSSMLQDVRAGRPTEIEHITGYLVAEGARLGVETPANAALLEGVRRLAA